MEQDTKSGSELPVERSDDPDRVISHIIVRKSGYSNFAQTICNMFVIL